MGLGQTSSPKQARGVCLARDKLAICPKGQNCVCLSKKKYAQAKMPQMSMHQCKYSKKSLPASPLLFGNYPRGTYEPTTRPPPKDEQLHPLPSKKNSNEGQKRQSLIAQKKKKGLSFIHFTLPLSPSHSHTLTTTQTQLNQKRPVSTCLPFLVKVVLHQWPPLPQLHQPP
jgi:hypothetical protein